MPCADCERINQEILRKAKEVADALLSVIKLSPAWPYDAHASVDTRLNPEVDQELADQVCARTHTDATLQQDGKTQ
jgi:hypothetical protein